MLACGSCRATITEGSPLLEIQIEARRLPRCCACALHLFTETPPVDLPAISVRAPHHARLSGRMRQQADFMTTGQLARRYIDVRRRQAGDSE